MIPTLGGHGARTTTPVGGYTALLFAGFPYTPVYMNAAKPARTAKPDKSPLPAEPTTFGRYLRFVRRAQELNQSDVAALLNVTQVSISKWEAEEAVPSPEHHLALSRLLRIPVSEVRDRVERQVLEQRAAKLRRGLAATEQRLNAFQVPRRRR